MSTQWTGLTVSVQVVSLDVGTGLLGATSRQATTLGLDLKVVILFHSAAS